MKLKIWRYIVWMTFLGVIGILIQSKTAIITTDDILSGLLFGGSIGFLLASIFELRENRKSYEKDNY